MSGRRQVAQHRALLLRVAGRPEALAALTLGEWDLVVRQAMRGGILARLCFQLDELATLEKVPERPRRHLESARVLALKHQHAVRWEVACGREGVGATGVPTHLLQVQAPQRG